jgi:hypothetical protein
VTASQSTGTFYRVIRGTHPQELDFECDALKYCRAFQAGVKGGYVPTHGAGLRQWSGISVYNSLQSASNAAKEYTLGRFVAELVQPPSDGRNVLTEEYGGHGHYIIWGRPRMLLNCVRQTTPAIPI